MKEGDIAWYYDKDFNVIKSTIKLIEEELYYNIHIKTYVMENDDHVDELNIFDNEKDCITQLNNYIENIIKAKLIQIENIEEDIKMLKTKIIK